MNLASKTVVPPMARLLVVLALIAAACGSNGDSSAPATTGPSALETTTTSPPVPTTRIGGIEVPSIVPPLDLSRADVEPGDVVFDTFDGGSIPLDQADAELIVRLRDAIPPLNAPVYGEHGEGDWLAPDDLVLGL